MTKLVSRIVSARNTTCSLRCKHFYGQNGTFLRFQNRVTNYDEAACTGIPLLKRYKSKMPNGDVPDTGWYERQCTG